jgi:hypothetical protein
VKTRLLLAVVCMLAIPMWFSNSRSDKLTTQTPFSTVALAGHTLYGGWCECVSPGCLCAPGEEETGHSARPASDQTRRPVDQGRSPLRAGSGFDYGTGVLMLALGLFVWSRLRA